MRFLPLPNFHPPASEQNGDGESPPCSAGEGYRLTPLMAVVFLFFFVAPVLFTFNERRRLPARQGRVRH